MPHMRVYVLANTACYLREFKPNCCILSRSLKKSKSKLDRFRTWVGSVGCNKYRVLGHSFSTSRMKLKKVLETDLRIN